MDNDLAMVLKNDINDIVIEFDKKGEELLEKNNFFKDLTEIMSDEKFMNFFNKYFKTMQDIKTTVIYMKLYDLFKEKYNNISNKELSNYVNIYLLHKTMTNSKLRSSMISATIKHLEDNKEDILEIASKDINKKLN
tara:strand:+ start:6440 stop:6847 length:408 start_codon:yes stop_codon:yes gene_type:complete